MATWNAAYEAIPGEDTVSPSTWDDAIRSTKTETRSRFNNEHNFYQTIETGKCFHLEGSAVAFHQATEPTTRPNSSTLLDSSDAGRLFIDSDTYATIACYDGETFNTTTERFVASNDLARELKILEIAPTTRFYEAFYHTITLRFNIDIEPNKIYGPCIATSIITPFDATLPTPATYLYNKPLKQFIFIIANVGADVGTGNILLFYRE